MGVLPKEDTQQERLVAEVLSEFGLRYVEQYVFGKFTVDFWLPELNMVVEADGPFGHYRKADMERDGILYNDHKVELIIHVTSSDKFGIKEALAFLEYENA